MSDSGAATFYDWPTVTALCREAPNQPDEDLTARFHAECPGNTEHTVRGRPVVVYRCACRCHAEERPEAER